MRCRTKGCENEARGGRMGGQGVCRPYDPRRYCDECNREKWQKFYGDMKDE